VAVVADDMPSDALCDPGDIGEMRIPTKPSSWSNLKPSRHSDFKPSMVPR
jgi:hypothetical protein